MQRHHEGEGLWLSWDSSAAGCSNSPLSSMPLTAASLSSRESSSANVANGLIECSIVSSSSVSSDARAAHLLNRRVKSFATNSKAPRGETVILRVAPIYPKYTARQLRCWVGLCCEPVVSDSDSIVPAPSNAYSQAWETNLGSSRHVLTKRATKDVHGSNPACKSMS